MTKPTPEIFARRARAAGHQAITPQQHRANEERRREEQMRRQREHEEALTKEQIVGALRILGVFNDDDADLPIDEIKAKYQQQAIDAYRLNVNDTNLNLDWVLSEENDIPIEERSASLARIMEDHVWPRLSRDGFDFHAHEHPDYYPLSLSMSD
jgi:hypothetical protein